MWFKVTLGKSDPLGGPLAENDLVRVRKAKMKRIYLVFIGMCLLSGCELSSPSIQLPTAPLTEEQKIAIAKEDAESCNCGRSIDAQVASTNN